VADGFELVDVRRSNDVFVAYGPQRQIFVADDVVGSLNLDPVRADDWSRDLPGILRKLDRGHLLVWTARRYILEEALAESRLRESVAGFPGTHEVLVEVGALSTTEKAEILYNHAKNAQLRTVYRRLIRNWALAIVSHQEFRPERIRQLVENVLAPEAAGTDTVSWEEILGFLSNPSERWIQAYGKLSVPERVLLSAILDFDDRAPMKDLKQSYELRISEFRPSYLPFDQCVGRLTHSFLQTGKAFTGEEFVTLQHPSLRDMLLLQLREDPAARKRYISLASPFALASIIGGIASVDSGKAEPEHAVIPTSEAELGLFLQRLRELCYGVLEARQWDLLLGTAERLIPVKPATDVQTALQRLGAHVELLAERSEPSEMALGEFAGSREGAIVTALLEGFSSPQTFENNQRLPPDDWLRLLTRFYNLASYTLPPVYPRFSAKLCESVRPDSLESVRLLSLIREFEPLVARQKITPAIKQELRSVLFDEITHLVTQGSGFSAGDDPDEYDYWYGQTGQLLEATAEFARWSGMTKVEGLDDLRNLHESVERPRERDEDYSSEDSSSTHGPYWTIARIFEDL
jgi:hypothetical protein